MMKKKGRNISRRGGGGVGLETCNVFDLPRDAGCEGGVDVCAEEDEEVEEPSEECRSREPSLLRDEAIALSGYGVS